MNDERVGTEKARDDLRETLRSVILGEVRLRKRGHDDIVEICRETYIQEVCPQCEWETFIRLTSDEIKQAVTQFAAEKGEWPEVTDCDRLDRVEAKSRDRGILFWQASSCCDTCTRSELGDRMEMINCRHPGFLEIVCGYAFFVDQNLPGMLAEDPSLSFFICYGWFPKERPQATPEELKSNTLEIGRNVCECLKSEGFEVDWDGDVQNRIGLSIKWQRRTMLA